MTTPKDKEIDRAAVLAQALVGVTPAHARDSVLAQLGPWRPHLIKCRRAGYSVEQLATCLAKPEIGITVKPASLKRYLGAIAKKRVSTPEASTAAKPTTAGAA